MPESSAEVELNDEDNSGDNGNNDIRPRRSERNIKNKKVFASTSSSKNGRGREEEMSRSRPRCNKLSEVNLLQCGRCKMQFLYETTLICHRRIIHHENVNCMPTPLPMPKDRANSRTVIGLTSTCPICQLVVCRNNIREHIAIHTRSISKPWMCTICSKEFKSQIELYAHQATHNKSTVTCQHCAKRIPRLEMLTHIRTCLISHKGGKVSKSKSGNSESRWRCKLCGINFTEKQLMISHMQATHMQAKRYSCKICDRRFDRVDLVRLHIKRFHRNNEGPPSVNPCPAPSTPLSSKDFDDNDNCSIPDIDTTIVPDKKRHEEVFPILVNRYLCKTCTSDFCTDEELDYHMLAMHADKDNSTCTVCSRKLQDEFCLKLHLKSHTEVKPFSCHLCGKAYSDKKTFFCHLRDFHKMVAPRIVELYPDIFKLKNRYQSDRQLRGENQFKRSSRKGGYPCEVCGKIFSHLNAVVQHRRIVHDKERNFICSYCGKSFARRSYFVIHEKLHTSTEASYKCHLCEKSYRLPGSLRVHLQAIHNPNEKSFICETCGRHFNRKDNLRIHVKSVHLKIPTRNPRGGRTNTNNYINGGKNRIYGPDIPPPKTSKLLNKPSPLSTSALSQQEHFTTNTNPQSTSMLSMPILSESTQEHKSHMGYGFSYNF